MAPKSPSAAARAAAKLRPTTSTAGPVPSGPWTVEMMREALEAFGDFDHLNRFDVEACLRHIHGWARVVRLIAAGHFVPAALPHAEALVRRGVAWLDDNPQFIPINGAVWGLDEVEAAASWFGLAQRRRPDADDRARGEALVRTVHAGLIVAEASALAKVLAERVADWLLGADGAVVNARLT